MTSRELTLEICHKKNHFYYVMKDHKMVTVLKKVVADVLQIKGDFQLVWKANETTWAVLDEKKRLSTSGLKLENTKFQSPTLLGVLLKGEVEPEIEPLSKPPPMLEILRNEDQQQD